MFISDKLIAHDPGGPLSSSTYCSNSTNSAGCSEDPPHSDCSADDKPFLYCGLRSNANCPWWKPSEFAINRISRWYYCLPDRVIIWHSHVSHRSPIIPFPSVNIRRTRNCIANIKCHSSMDIPWLHTSQYCQFIGFIWKFYLIWTLIAFLAMATKKWNSRQKQKVLSFCFLSPAKGEISQKNVQYFLGNLFLFFKTILIWEI